MHDIQITEDALVDLEQIRAHIAQDNPEAARRVAAQIIKALDRLGSFPNSAASGREQGLRELAIGRHLVVYRVEPAKVIVLRVWHGAQKR